MSVEGLRAVAEHEPVAAGAVAPLAVSPEDAAEALGTTRSNIYDLIRSGELRSFRIGRRRRIAVAELERFVERMDRTGGIRRVTRSQPAGS